MQSKSIVYSIVYLIVYVTANIFCIRTNLIAIDNFWSSSTFRFAIDVRRKTDESLTDRVNARSFSYTDEKN